RKSVGYTALAFGGVATLTPRLFAAVYGMPQEVNLATMTRLWGTRTALLGALTLAVNGPVERRTLMTAMAAMNAADTVVISAAQGVPVRTRAMGAFTTATLAGVISYALTQRS
ncbi:MAG: hypothetical protein ACTHOK_12970, partial [Nocardioidaceae bacterium]